MSGKKESKEPKKEIENLPRRKRTIEAEDSCDADNEASEGDNEITSKTTKNSSSKKNRSKHRLKKHIIIKRYKSRLILGDGSFSFSRALVEKNKKQHPHLPSAIHVTEYASEENLRNTYISDEEDNLFKNFHSNVTALRKMGARTSFNVDARKIHERFKGRRFQRIHFNFPYWNDPKAAPATNKENTRKLVGNFFKSATAIQKPGDRIHMALAKGYNADPVWYEAATYGVAEFCEKYGYVCVKKRNFIDPKKGRRYAGYSHVKTASNVSVGTAEKGREYIFEKRILGKKYDSFVEKRNTRLKVPTKVLIDNSTDSGSSSYIAHSSSDEEISTNPSSQKAKNSNNWYDDITINSLLAHYFEHDPTLKILKALPLEDENEITADLISARLLSELEIGVNLYYLPLRIGGNHWVGLYIDRTPGSPLVYWIDPYGGLSKTRKEEILAILNNSGIFDVALTNAHIRFQENKLQQDGFNCGPWIIEILRFVREKGRFPELGEIDIIACRNAHRNTVFVPFKSRSSQKKETKPAKSSAASILSQMHKSPSHPFYDRSSSTDEKRVTQKNNLSTLEEIILANKADMLSSTELRDFGYEDIENAKLIIDNHLYENMTDGALYDLAMSFSEMKYEDVAEIVTVIIEELYHRGSKHFSEIAHVYSEAQLLEQGVFPR